jgi:putative heme-binding domain-containing protein
VIPYSVNAPGWHDGASIARWLAVPNRDTINPNASRGWDFMDGAVLVQTLSLEMEHGNPASRKKVETRLLTHQAGEWFGYSYAWDDAQTDARLVRKEGEERKLRILDAAAPGGSRQQTWHYVSRAECMVCHSRAANFVLGLSTLQMNRTEKYGTTTANQLNALAAAAYFQPALSSSPESLSKLANPYDASANLEVRVRSYLHANCSQCHVADGGGNARMELEFTTAREKMGVIGVPPLQGTFGIRDAEIVAPGDPFRSVMLYRISKLGGGRMPQAGSFIVDHQAVDLFHRWIQSLPTKQPDTSAAARLGEQKQQEVALTSLQNSNLAPPASGEHLGRLLANTSGSMRLLRAVDQERLHPAVKNHAIQTASAHPNPAVRDLFERFVPEERRTARLGTNIDSAKLLARIGNVERGRELFFNAALVNCQTCHQIAGKGRDVGPDLSHVGKKYNGAQILENIVDPSKTIEQKYVVYAVQTADGKTHTGIVAERSAESAALKDAQGNLVRFKLKDVETFEPQKKSLMPDGLLKDLTAEQAADLLAFLESLK